MLNASCGAGSSGRRNRSWRRPAASRIVSAWSVFLLLPAIAVVAEDQRDVVLTGIEVSPAAPGAEMLCKLTATIENTGGQAVYSFGFDVEVNGHSLPVYEKQLFLQVIEAGGAGEVALYNFWTSETGRPPPPDGRLEVLVRLREARWVEVSEVEEDGEAVEVWTPVGDVSGLPQTVELTLELK